MKDTNRRGESTDERRYGVLSDRRGVSEVLGAILVFALVLAVLVLIQVAAVPAANQQVEFEHDQAAQEDLQDMRTAIIEASSSGEPRAASMRLGVRYPPRLFLINPGPVAGTLRTTDAGAYATSGTGDELDLTEICGTGDLGTDHVTYSIAYNEYRGNSVSTLENTVVAQRYENSDSPLVKNGQILVKGNTITLYIIKGDESFSGINKESINFIPGGTGTDIGTISNDWTLHVPTTLDAAKWETNANLLESEIDAGGDSSPSKYVKSINDGADGIDIEFEGGKEYTVRCTVVGLNEDPGTNPADDIEDPQGGGEDVINPNVAGALVFKNSQVVDTVDGKAIEITWENIAPSGDIEVTHVRFPFYSADTQGNAGDEIPESGDFEGTDVTRGGPYNTYSATVNPNGGELTVNFQLFCDLAQTEVFEPGTGDYFALNLRYTYDGTERTSTYFISPISDLTGNQNRCKASGASPNSPSIDSLTVTDDTDTATNPNRADYGVSYIVSDPDNDISSIDIELINSAGTTVDSRSPNQNSGTETLSENGGEASDYYVQITVTDGTNTVTERLPASTTDTADGSGVYTLP